MIEGKGLAAEKTLPFVNRRIGCHGTSPTGEGCHAALGFTPSIMGQAATDRKTGPPLSIQSHLSIQQPCESVRKVTGTEREGSGFSRFPLLAVGQGESQQPTDSPRSSSRINDVDPSNHGGVGKNRGRLGVGLFLTRWCGLRASPLPFPLSSRATGLLKRVGKK
jgi:hypothetical protein